ncbi:atypical PIKK PI3K protein kinase [Gigaspora rosea]|uniref:Phosphatidylinositol 3-kinase VPS34 n=1 Tax=Gigaspora rosea TaxID=44941 RepID=A0A397TZW3_9GLOM|nr:atypical PIKK PI3K protein kinase [Gigaspora rosea]
MDYGSAQAKDFSYSFCLTKDLDLPFTVRISSLEGIREKKSFTTILSDPSLKFTGVQTSNFSDLYVSIQLYCDNKPLTVPIKTSYKSFKSNWVWNEWLTIPVKYRDLTVTSQLALTVWDVYGPRKVVPVGGTTFRLFGKHNTLRRGKHKLYLWPDVEADGYERTSTPSKVGDKNEMDRLEKLVKRYERNDMAKLEWLDNLAFRQIEKIHKQESSKSKNLYLYIDLPKFDFPVVFSEPVSMDYPVPSVTQPPVVVNSHGHTSTVTTSSDPNIILIIDPEIARENPVEAKHRRIVRSHRNGPFDRDLKPNAKIRDELNGILKYPPTQPLTSEEKDLLWKFRFYLTRDKKALTKFLKCVVWTDPTEVKQAVELLPQWVDIDLDDALELLGANFENRAVRGYAVSQLKKADDEELMLYLLQLVQALKFENISDKSSSSSLAEFLIERAIKNPILGNNFYWYLMVECEDKVVGKMYGKITFQFMTAMKEIPTGLERRDILRRQAELVVALSSISKDIRIMKEARPKKIERLRAIISDPKNGLLQFPPLPLPLDARVEVTGIIPEKTTVFKSNLFPLRLTFTLADGGEYPVIFKTGDDLRQDQLVIQIITLMDKLLRKENLDLKLTPYKVLPTGSDHGVMQFITSSSLANVLSEYNGSLLQFLKAHHPEEKAVGTYGVSPAVMDTYVKSCAGYCVITYLLGVGDRHLDNLLLSPDGNLFHVDFGFILGRDPKPFPPPMKLCKEMVEAMGGANSIHYQRFKSYCYIAFNILRKSANLILNLLALMVDANITDIKIEPDKAVWKVKKFRLDLTEEEAIKYFQILINDSVSALFPQVIETIHKFAQYWRR